MCLTAKPRSEFYIRADSNRPRRECKACLIAQHRQRHTGCSPEEYARLLAHQGRKCAICSKGVGRMGFAADHCHTTGAIRGLLCSNCNTGLGLFRDRPGLLLRAAKYLEEKIV